MLTRIRCARCLVLLLLGAVVPTSAFGQISAADSTALIATSQLLMDAITSGDTTVWATQLAPRWFLTDEEGHHITRSEFLGDLRGLPAGQSGKLQLANWHLVSDRGVAVLSYDIDEQHNYYGQELRTRFHATDTWTQIGGGWKMLASQVTALPTPIAGRSVEPRILDQYAGRYRLTDGIEFQIAASDSGLSLVRGTRPPERLYAIDERIFIRHGVRGFWLFERDAGGAVVRLVNWRDNNPVVWERLGD